MKERTLFLITITFVVIMTIIESRQDYWIITSGATGGVWKLWGNTLCFGWIMVGGFTVSYFKRSWTILLWIPILWMVWWIIHDTFIGLFLTGNLLHVGLGKFDQYMLAIAVGSPAIYLGVRLFLLMFMILVYKRFAKETVYEIKRYKDQLYIDPQ